MVPEYGSPATTPPPELQRIALDFAESLAHLQLNERKIVLGLLNSMLDHAAQNQEIHLRPIFTLGPMHEIPSNPIPSGTPSSTFLLCKAQLNAFFHVSHDTHQSFWRAIHEILNTTLRGELGLLGLDQIVHLTTRKDIQPVVTTAKKSVLGSIPAPQTKPETAFSMSLRPSIINLLTKLEPIPSMSNDPLRGERLQRQLHSHLKDEDTVTLRVTVNQIESFLREQNFGDALAVDEEIQEIISILRIKLEMFR